MLELIPWISIEVIHNGRVQGSRGTQITIYYDFFSYTYFVFLWATLSYIWSIKFSFFSIRKYLKAFFSLHFSVSFLYCA